MSFIESVLIPIRQSYTYDYSNIDPDKEVFATNNMFNCLRLIASEKQAIGNFELPYLFG